MTKLMGCIDEVFVFHEVMDKADELREFVDMVGEMDVSPIEAVV